MRKMPSVKTVLFQPGGTASLETLGGLAFQLFAGRAA
jgi:hypothetical protein